MENINTLNSQTDSEMPISLITLKNSEQIKLEMQNTILKDQYKRAKKTILELEKKEAISVKLLQIISNNLNKFPNKYKKIFKNQIGLELKSYSKNKEVEEMSDLNPEIKNLAIELRNFEQKIILKKGKYKALNQKKVLRSYSERKFDKNFFEILNLKKENIFLKKKLKKSEKKNKRQKFEKKTENKIGNVLREIPTLENSKIVSINSEKDIFSKVGNNKISIFNKKNKEIKQNLLCDYRVRLESSEILDKSLKESNFELKLIKINKKTRNKNFEKKNFSIFNEDSSKNLTDDLSNDFNDKNFINNFDKKNISIFNEENYCKKLSDNLLNKKKKNFINEKMDNFLKNPMNIDEKNFMEENDSDISKFDLKSINDTSSIIKEPNLRINLLKKFEKVTNSKIENNLHKLNNDGNISFVKKNLKENHFENTKNNYNDENFKTQENNRNEVEKKTENKIRKKNNLLNNKKIKKKIFNLEEKISKIKNQLSTNILKTKITNKKNFLDKKRTSSVENSGIQNIFKKSSPFNYKNVLKKNYSKKSLLNKTKKRKKSLLENNFEKIFFNKNKKRNSEIENHYFTQNTKRSSEIENKIKINKNTKRSSETENNKKLYFPNSKNNKKSEKNYFLNNKKKNYVKKTKELNKSKSFRLIKNSKIDFLKKICKTSNFNTLNSSDQNSNPNKKKLIYKNLNVEYELEDTKNNNLKKNSGESFFNSEESDEQFGFYSNRSKDSKISINEKSRYKKKFNFKMF